MKHLLNSKCSIKEKVETQGLYGEITFTFNTTQGDIPCRLDSAPKNIKISDDSYKTNIRAYILFLEKDSLLTPLTKANTIEINSKDYEILDIMYYDNERTTHHIEVYLKAQDNN